MIAAELESIIMDVFRNYSNVERNTHARENKYTQEYNGRVCQLTLNLYRKHL